nr:LysE family translocator [Marinicella sp. W31]MDC2877354.1 LysE family translocator [Marinicella sp. W31]
MPHISGVVAGFALLMAGVGAGLGAVITAFPPILIVAKIAGSAYLLWIAWKIGSTRKLSSGETTSGKPLTFFQAVAFQWVNPKAWIMALTAMSVYTDPEHYPLSVALVACIFGLITIPSISLWAGFGSGLRHWLSRGNRLKWFNIGMALVLVASLWPMLR